MPTILGKLGFDYVTVPEQDIQDGRFPTVESPNPENAPTLKMAADLADKVGADAIIGTDPDCDRMGVCGQLVGRDGRHASSCFSRPA